MKYNNSYLSSWLLCWRWHDWWRKLSIKTLERYELWVLYWLLAAYYTSPYMNPGDTKDSLSNRYSMNEVLFSKDILPWNGMHNFHLPYLVLYYAMFDKTILCFFLILQQPFLLITKDGPLANGRWCINKKLYIWRLWCNLTQFHRYKCWIYRVKLRFGKVIIEKL